MHNESKSIYIDGENLKLEDVMAVARHGAVVELTKDAKQKVIQSRKLVDRIVSEGQTAYGITTGFGELSEVYIQRGQCKNLQRNLIRSHSAGVGKPLNTDVTMAMMLLRANALAKGYSGIKLKTLETLIEMINLGVCPVVPELGSVGASGDLVPLAHMSLVLIGEGEAFYDNQRISGKLAMQKCGLKPIVLDSKEGLALVNGTQATTAVGALAVWDAMNLVKHADLAGGMSLEALCGTIAAFDERVSQTRLHSGQSICAEHIRRITKNSGLLGNGKKKIVQDAYSLRCLPQVHGAILDTINYVIKIIETEINSATDNPLIFGKADNKGVDAISCGNFHGHPVALALDFLAIALAGLGSMSERRVERLNNPNLSRGLPAFLTRNPGLNSGYMIPQYTAAALVAENKILASPASVDSIPLSANKEDHVPMAMGAARKATQIIRNLEFILAIEYLCVSQALDLRDLKSGAGTAAAHEIIRKYIPTLEEDESSSSSINKITELIQTGEIMTHVEREIGTLTVG
jgi:histidine ammonia-lyase